MGVAETHIHTFLFFFLCVYMPIDINVVLWKVKNKCDLNLTILSCTFLQLGGYFIALIDVSIYIDIVTSKF